MRLSGSDVTCGLEKKHGFAASVHVEIAEVTFHDEILFCRKDVYLRVLTPHADVATNRAFHTCIHTYMPRHIYIHFFPYVDIHRDVHTITYIYICISTYNISISRIYI